MPVNPGDIRTIYYKNGKIAQVPILRAFPDTTTPVFTDGNGISYYGGIVIIVPNKVYLNEIENMDTSFVVRHNPTDAQIEEDLSNNGGSVSYSSLEGTLTYDVYPPAVAAYLYIPNTPAEESISYMVNGTQHTQKVSKVFKVTHWDGETPSEFEEIGTCQEPLFGTNVIYNTITLNRDVSDFDNTSNINTLICYFIFTATSLAVSRVESEPIDQTPTYAKIYRTNGVLTNDADAPSALPRKVALIEVLAPDTEVGFGARWGLLDEVPFKGGKLITVLKDGNTLEDYNSYGDSVVDYQLYTENNDLTSIALEDCFVKLDDTHTDAFDNDPTYSGTYDPTIHNLPFFSPIGKLYINSELNENYLNTYPEPYVSGFEGNTYIYLDPVLYADYSKGDTIYNSSDVLVAIIEERIPANPTYPSTGVGDPGFVYVYEPAGNYDLLANYTGGVIFSILKKGKTQQNYDPTTDIISKFIIVNPTYSGGVPKLYPLWTEADFMADTTHYNVGELLTGPYWTDRLERKYGYSSVDNYMELDPSFEIPENTALRITNYNSLLSDVYTPLSFEDPNNETITVAFEEKKNESGNEGGDPTLVSRFDDPLAYPVYGSPSKAIISTALLQELASIIKSRYSTPDPLSIQDMIDLLRQSTPVTEL